MCKWESQEKIDEKLEQIKDMWSEICDCIEIEPEIIPFSKEVVYMYIYIELNQMLCDVRMAI